MQTFTIVLSLYFLSGSLVSLFVGRKTLGNPEGFFLGNRALGGVISSLSYAATTYSTFMMVGLVGLAYASGIGALIFESVYLVATVLLLLALGPRIQALAEEHRFVSPLDLFSWKFGRMSAFAAGVVSVLSLVPYTTAQLVGAALIMNAYSTGYTTAVLIIAFLFAFWALVGGMKGVAVTDSLQGIFMFMTAVFAFFWTKGEFRGIEFSTFPNKTWTPAFFINITLPWIFFAISNPPVLQRLFVLNRRANLKKMVGLFGLFGLFYTLIVTLMGFYARYGSNTGSLPVIGNADQVTANLISAMPAWLGISLSVAIIIASVTTGNSIILSLSSVATLNLVGSRFDKVKIGRLFILAFTATVALFALTNPGYIVFMAVASSRLLLSLTPSVFAALMKRSFPPYSSLFSISGGFLTALVSSILLPEFSSVLTLGVSVLLFFVGCLFPLKTKESNEKEGCL